MAQSSFCKMGVLSIVPPIKCFDLVEAKVERPAFDDVGPKRGMRLFLVLWRIRKGGQKKNVLASRVSLML